MSPLPPFLEKLQQIAFSVKPDVAGWSTDGKEFEVYSDAFEADVLNAHFKGTKKTFIRQLHFYGFKKTENIGEFWTFSHPQFLRDEPGLIHDIKRKTRLADNPATSLNELKVLRAELSQLKNTIKVEIEEIKAQVSLVFKLLNQTTATAVGSPSKSLTKGSSSSSVNKHGTAHDKSSSNTKTLIPVQYEQQPVMQQQPMPPNAYYYPYMQPHPHAQHIPPQYMGMYPPQYAQPPHQPDQQMRPMMPPHMMPMQPYPPQQSQSKQQPVPEHYNKRRGYEEGLEAAPKKSKKVAAGDEMFESFDMNDNEFENFALPVEDYVLNQHAKQSKDTQNNN